MSVFDELKKHTSLLTMEYEYEKRLFENNTHERDIYKLVKQGLCRFPVSIERGRYNSLNQYVVDVISEGVGSDDDLSDDLTESSFEYGRNVCFFYKADDGGIKYCKFQGVVVRSDLKSMVVSIPSVDCASAFSENRLWGVQLYFDVTSYKIMFDTIKTVIAAKDGRLACLRDIMMGGQPMEAVPAWNLKFPWLNKSQELAVNKVLATKDVSIVHGPPGTGKTTTLVEAINECLLREAQVLVCAQSNTAVDWISEKLLDRGINVLRIGNPTRINDKMLSFTYERRYESHSAYPDLWRLRKMLRDKNCKNKDSIREKITDLEIKIESDLFSEARVISCTLVGAASKVLSHRRFSTLFIDEAAQALMAACFIPIVNAQRVIFAGDFFQLSPTIKCFEAEKLGLGKTLMERVAKNKPECVTMLNVQYRMHRDIMEFPSQVFYDGKLEASPMVEYRGIMDWDSALEWIDTSNCNFREHHPKEGVGRINKGEAKLMVDELTSYIERITVKRFLDEHLDVGVISPYRAQASYIRHLLKCSPFFTKTLRKCITVQTVDGFQGQERDAIFISLVRANDNGNIGFLSDLRRMNVAMTRSKMKLVIVGDAATLSKHPFYEALYNYVNDRGIVTTSNMSGK